MKMPRIEWLLLAAGLAPACSKDKKEDENVRGTEYSVTVVNDSRQAIRASAASGGSVYLCKPAYESYEIAAHSTQTVTGSFSCEYQTEEEMAKFAAESRFCASVPGTFAQWSLKLRYVQADQTKYEVAVPSPLRLAWVESGALTTLDLSVPAGGTTVAIGGTDRIAVDANEFAYGGSADGKTLAVESEEGESLYLVVPDSLIPEGSTVHPETAALLSKDVGVAAPEGHSFLRPTQAGVTPHRGACSFAGTTLTCSDSVKGCVGTEK